MCSQRCDSHATRLVPDQGVDGLTIVLCALTSSDIFKKDSLGDFKQSKGLILRQALDNALANSQRIHSLLVEWFRFCSFMALQAF